MPRPCSWSCPPRTRRSRHLCLGRSTVCAGHLGLSVLLQGYLADAVTGGAGDDGFTQLQVWRRANARMTSRPCVPRFRNPSAAARSATTSGSGISALLRCTNSGSCLAGGKDVSKCQRALFERRVAVEPNMGGCDTSGTETRETHAGSFHPLPARSPNGPSFSLLSK